MWVAKNEFSRKRSTGENFAEFVLPVAAMRLRFVEDLEAEDMVLEISAKLLPCDPLTGMTEEVIGDLRSVATR